MFSTKVSKGFTRHHVKLNYSSGYAILCSLLMLIMFIPNISFSQIVNNGSFETFDPQNLPRKIDSILQTDYSAAGTSGFGTSTYFI